MNTGSYEPRSRDFDIMLQPQQLTLFFFFFFFTNLYFFIGWGNIFLIGCLIY